MAAHAVSLLGHEPVIYSKKVKSKMFGAMYLHKPIYGINAPKSDFELTVIKAGTSREYAEKVYGDPDHPVSFDKYQSDQVPGWDLTETYRRLWDVYGDTVHDQNLDIDNIADISYHYAIVLSTIPAPLLCHEQHSFQSQPIWVLHGIDHEAPLRHDDWMIYYMGDPSVDWYRYTQLGKYQAWEYARNPSALPLRLSAFELSEGVKPISNDCDCPNENIHRLGRFGKWEKNVLTHHAFEEASQIVREEARALH